MAGADGAPGERADRGVAQTATEQPEGTESEADAAWLAAVAAALATPEEHVVARELDLGGHELALLDFDPAAAGRLRRLGRLIRFPEAPDVRSALAISGSVAQGRVHPFPADADFFERVHLSAPDRATATRRFAELVRANALQTGSLPGLRLVEVDFGPRPDSDRSEPGAVCWSPAEVRSGLARRSRRDGTPIEVDWYELPADPAFVKLEWHLLDPDLGGPAPVSKVIDATWEAPGGAIESLDGLIDADFQDVYLAAGDAELAAGLARHAALDLGRARYLRIMDEEIAKYLRRQPPDYVKVAKRLYNRCRLTGRYAEALWLRDLFDEEPARLVQLRARLALIGDRDADDPAVTATELAALLDGLASAPDSLAACAEAVADCRRLLAAATAEALLLAVARLDAALAETAGRVFGAHLRGSPAIAALLAEIEGSVTLSSSG